MKSSSPKRQSNHPQDEHSLVSGTIKLDIEFKLSHDKHMSKTNMTIEFKLKLKLRGIDKNRSTS